MKDSTKSCLPLSLRQVLEGVTEGERKFSGNPPQISRVIYFLCKGPPPLPKVGKCRPKSRTPITYLVNVPLLWFPLINKMLMDFRSVNDEINQKQRVYPKRVLTRRGKENSNRSRQRIPFYFYVKDVTMCSSCGDYDRSNIMSRGGTTSFVCPTYSWTSTITWPLVIIKGLGGKTPRHFVCNVTVCRLRNTTGLGFCFSLLHWEGTSLF